MVVNTKKKKKKSWRALFETATSLIKLVVISLSGGEKSSSPPLQEISA